MKTHPITTYILTNGLYCGEDPHDVICPMCHEIDQDEGGYVTRACQRYGDHLRFDWKARNVLRCADCIRDFGKD